MSKHKSRDKHIAPKIITGLDIGTTKVCAVIAKEDGNGRLYVVGIGSVPFSGLKQGAVVNIDLAVQSIQRAVIEAETMAGVKVDSVYVGIAGNHIRGVNSKAMVSVASKDHKITQSDIDRVIEMTKTMMMPIDRRIIHVIPQEFIVGNRDRIQDPFGLWGTRLEVKALIFTVAVNSAQSIIKSVERAGYKVEEIVLESLANSMAVLDESERNRGVVLVDMGSATTNIAMFCEGHIRHNSVVALGGQNVTNDIAIGLRTFFEEAEIIKINHGCTYSFKNGLEETLLVPGDEGSEPRIISRSALIEIIQPRIKEILDLTQNEMENSDFMKLMTAGAVITGGGAILPGTVELAEQIWNIPVRLGIPEHLGGPANMVRSPIYSTATGLAFYGHRYWEGTPFYRKPAKPPINQLNSKMIRFFDDLFPDSKKSPNNKSMIDKLKQPGWEIPFAIKDAISFSVTSPNIVIPRMEYILDVWAHLGQQRDLILKMAREESSEKIIIKSEGPVEVVRGTTLNVRLKIKGIREIGRASCRERV